jgi:erythronate-4-phosphate dehydrogenase
MMVDLNTALAADVISLHVPLTRSGDYPTFHLLGKSRIGKLKSGCILLNTSRGAVVDNEQLKEALCRRQDLTVILDVWEEEPGLDPALLQEVALGTPHIAGYSREAKLKATTWLCRQVADFLGHAKQNSSLQSVQELSPIKLAPIEVETPDQADCFCAEVLARAFSIRKLDRQLRAECSAGVVPSAATFDRLRRQLTERREFSAWQVVDSGFTPLQRKFLHTMGFAFIPH